jgi:HEXXH motif-containing protein
VESSDRIFSFSDDSAPNVLYVAPCAGEALLGPDDLGDSLLHEFLHQVLYQMERDAPVLFDKVYPRFPAPWREGLRPSGGFFHGTFVFAGLSQYWGALATEGLENVDCDKAAENAQRFAKQALYGISSLRQFALLTPRGSLLLDQLALNLGVTETRMKAPGLAAPCYTGTYETKETGKDHVRKTQTPAVSASI